MNETSEPASHEKWQTNTMQHRELRASCRSRVIERCFQFQYGFIVVYNLATGLVEKTSSKEEFKAATMLGTATSVAKSRLSDTEHDSVRAIPLLDLLNWLREFTDHRVDSEEPSSSEAGRSDLLPKLASSMHHLFTHFSME